MSKLKDHGCTINEHITSLDGNSCECGYFTHQLIQAHTEKAVREARTDGAIMGAKFGNPAPDLVEHNQLVRDGLRFEQRVELNKLEADTNQASEDREIDTVLDNYEAFLSKFNDETSKVNLKLVAKQAIKQLIRTEKLKLLAEVRERVVGEDEDRNHCYNENWKVEVDAQNYLRKEQRTALTKLEAEL